MSHRSDTTKVFVGSLPANTTVEELRNLFGAYGTIAECDVVNRCGFLHLENKQLAFKAIDELNNSNFKGSRISVEKGRQSRRGGGGGGGGGGGPMRGNRSYNRGGERRGPLRRGDRPMNMNERRYPHPPGDGGYGGGGDAGMYDRMYERRTLGERNMMDRQPFISPMMEHPGPYNMPPPPPYDMYRDATSKPMGGYDSSYDSAYPPLQNRNFVGPGRPRRGMPPPRRY